MAEPHGRRCASFLRDGFLLRRPLQELEVLAGRDVVDGDAIASGFLLLRRSLRMHSDSSQNEQTHQDQYARNCAGHAFLLLPGLPAKVLRMVPDELRRLFVKRSHRTPAPEACQTSSPHWVLGEVSRFQTVPTAGTMSTPLARRNGS